MTPAPSTPVFQAAVERPLSVVFQTPEGFEGHDYKVEIIAERQGLDAYDVVVDFRDLEAALDACLAPMDRRVAEVASPLALAELLAGRLAGAVPPPARLAEVALTDGRGRRVSVRP